MKTNSKLESMTMEELNGLKTTRLTGRHLSNWVNLIGLETPVMFTYEGKEIRLKAITMLKAEDLTETFMSREVAVEVEFEGEV